MATFSWSSIYNSRLRGAWALCFCLVMSSLVAHLFVYLQFCAFCLALCIGWNQVGSPGVSLGKLHTDSKGTLESCRERGTARLGWSLERLAGRQSLHEMGGIGIVYHGPVLNSHPHPHKPWNQKSCQIRNFPDFRIHVTLPLLFITPNRVL